EGRALAFMKMRSAALPPASPAKRELDEHLAALEQWMSETRTGSPVRRAGAEERAQVARALVDPTDESVERAAAAISASVRQAIAFSMEIQRTGQRPERADAIEAQRALDTGGPTMTALFLRYGDAKAALKHIDESSAKRVMLPGLYARLHGAAVDGETQ